MSDFIEEMIQNSPEWVFREVDEEDIEYFSKNARFTRLISKIFLLRNIKTQEDLDHFLHDDIYTLKSPFDFTQMLKTVYRVRDALHNREKIFIFGDRDVDGVLSTAMLYNMLRRFDADVFYKVPEGEYGYGLEKKDVELAHDKGVSLIITVDTGISCVSEIKYAKARGIDTIIIDHHTQTTSIPDAYSILNPKMEFETYPYRYLSAGGVVLKFIHAFVFSHTKNFNRTFVPLIVDGEKIVGAKVRNGIIEGYIHIEESIHYPIENNYMIVHDGRRRLPDYFTAWIRENKIGQINFLCSQSYDSIEEFTNLFIELFSRNQKRTIDFVRSFIDLSCISTVSDIMPLTEENRIIVKEGLKQIRKTTNRGLRVLLDYCDLPDRELTARDIAWSISPIINSAGRMGDADSAVRLFTTDDIHVANELSRQLIEYNEGRKAKGEKNLRIINPIVEEKYYKDPIIILSTSRAEHGVTGIIASKISKKYCKPVIVIVNDGKIGIGSGRGWGDCDLVSLIARCRDLLLRFGGHRSAVGFTIDTENIDSFRQRLLDIVSQDGSLAKNQEIIEIDEIISADDITFDFLHELSILEPTGVGNKLPKFAILDTTVVHPAIIGKDNSHIKFFIPTERGLIPVIGWGFAEKGQKIIQESPTIDIVFSVEDNRFNAERYLQLNLHDLRSSQNGEMSFID